MRARTQHGFSLVELAVVLAILGLLVGGILVGKAQIDAGRVNRVGVEGQQYLNAIDQFRNRFQGLPGDMLNATQYWGAATCPNGAGTGSQTCNGNGNKRIDNWDENYRAWQHLKNAELVTGNYSGRYTLVGSRGVGVPGVNVPAGPIANSGWTIMPLVTLSSTHFEFAYTDGTSVYNNYLIFGGVVANDYPYASLLVTADAKAIDTKYDDGLPGMGRILGGAAAQCATTQVTTTAKYNVAAAKNLCRLGWQIAVQ